MRIGPLEIKRARTHDRVDEAWRQERTPSVGPAAHYDLISAMAFGLLTTLGLREHHTLLDIGCGSLRIGRLLIPYLGTGNYVGIEPNEQSLRIGAQRQVGEDLMRMKRPKLIPSADPGEVPADRPYDFALAQSVFSHTGPKLTEGWIECAGARLADSGALVATHVPGPDKAPEGWTDWFVTYSDETMQAMANNNGMRFMPLTWRHPNQRWGLFAKPGFDTSWFEEADLTWNTYLDHSLGDPTYLFFQPEG
jgi:SAM-dependent methyltransferase